jgi:Short C-terminal domain
MMKSSLPAMLCLCLALSGCQGSFGPFLGMKEKDWLRTSIIADVIYTEGSIKAYRGGAGQSYYFKDGILVKIASGRISAEQIEKEFGPGDKAPKVQPAAGGTTGDLSTELRKLDALRKDGLITPEEFEAQKKKLLDKN